MLHGSALPEHVAGAEADAQDIPPVAVSVAYYSMLNAALSGADKSARTHRGTWNRFRILYVTTDAFDA